MQDLKRISFLKALLGRVRAAKNLLLFSTVIYLLLCPVTQRLFAQTQPLPVQLIESAKTPCPVESLADKSQNQETSCVHMPPLNPADNAEISKEERVKMLLLGQAWKLDQAAFLQLGSGVDQLLISIIADPSQMHTVYYLRALEALRLYPHERVANFLEVYIYENKDPVVIAQAFRSLISGFTGVDSPRVQRIALILIHHQDPVVQKLASSVLDRNTVIIKHK